MTDKVALGLLSTGLPGLDVLLGGGLPEFSFNLVAGPPGSGKTTLVGLLPRLYSPTAGSVRIDDHPVSRMRREDLVKAVAMVPQKPWLFSGTVASNLRMGSPDATDEELWAALHTAQAGFVEDLGMPIAQGGTNVSGGQRQRLLEGLAQLAQLLVVQVVDALAALGAEVDQLVVTHGLDRIRRKVRLMRGATGLRVFAT